MDFVQVKEPVIVSFGNLGFMVVSPTFDFTKLGLLDKIRIDGLVGEIFEIQSCSAIICECISDMNGQAGNYESFEIEHGAYYRMKGGG